MGLQIKAFFVLFVALFAVDAAFYRGEYRSQVVRTVAAPFTSVYGPGSPDHKPVRTR